MTVRRDPRLLELLDTRTPAGVTEVVWARPLRLTTYVGPADVPDELVTSIRVIVLVGESVVVCTNVTGGSHAWPGGRREPDETYAETACREVHEETGWLVDPRSLEPVGFLHLFNLGEPLPPYPHPDAVHLVMSGRATERSAEEWTDTEGYEVSSRLVPLAEACEAISADEPMCVPFLERLRSCV